RPDLWIRYDCRGASGGPLADTRSLARLARRRLVVELSSRGEGHFAQSSSRLCSLSTLQRETKDRIEQVRSNMTCIVRMTRASRWFASATKSTRHCVAIFQVDPGCYARADLLADPDSSRGPSNTGNWEPGPNSSPG